MNGMEQCAASIQQDPGRDGLMAALKIDAHHHFWNYDPVEYGWIAEDMEVIRRSFLPAT